MPAKGAFAHLNHEMTNATPCGLVDFMDMSFGSSTVWELYIKIYSVADAILVEAGVSSTTSAFGAVD